jgi:regulator of cell morphogenesis and NO signaling
MNLYDTSLAQIAQTIPGASAILNKYRLSFCCGGQHTLREATNKASIPTEDVHQALLGLISQASPNEDWQNAGNEELINHLLERFHKVHRQQLSELIRLAERVESVHSNKAECPLGLADHLKYMAHELEAHMQKEEQILFPMLAKGMHQMAGGPINVMRQDHDDHQDAIHQLDIISNHMQAPEGACNTWQALYLGLRHFKDDLLQHIALENDVLFARSA